MKAAVYHRYGGPEVVSVDDIPKPRPKSDEVLIRVEASSVTTADWRLRASAFPGVLWLPGRLMTGLFQPKSPVLGFGFAGTIDTIGSDTQGFAPGDAVFGYSTTAGAHAEYLVVSANGVIAPRPENLNAIEAAALPWGGLSALVFLRDVARLRRAERTLILGASGGVGALATQIALDMGARVTAVAGPLRQDLLAQLGADEVVDYSRTDPATLGKRFDVVFDTVGAMRYKTARSVLVRNGRFVPLNFGLPELAALAANPVRSTQIRIAVSGDRRTDLMDLSELVARGGIRPVVDSVYPLDQIAKAHARVETRHASGTVIVTPFPADNCVG